MPESLRHTIVRNVKGCSLLLSVYACFSAQVFAGAGSMAQDVSGMRLQIASRHVDQGVVRTPGNRAGEIGGRFVWQRLAFDWQWLTGIGFSYDENLLGGAFVLDAGDFYLANALLQAGVRRRGYPGVADRESRWEAWTRMDWHLAQHLVLVMDVYQGLNRGQTGFGIVGLDFPFWFSGIEFYPSIALGMDFGDVSGQRRLTENHVEYGVLLRQPVTESVSFYAEIKHSNGIGVDADGGDLPSRTVGILGCSIRL